MSALRLEAPTVAPVTAEEARARLATLTNDRAWSKKFLAGDMNARREFAQFTTAQERDAANPPDRDHRRR
jgi:hypothetical protein